MRIWLIIRRKERTVTSSEVNAEMMINNNTEERERGEEQDYRFTRKKVLSYCIIVGLISAILSIFINWLGLLSMAAFVFASITVWYLLGEKFHRWKERGVDEKAKKNDITTIVIIFLILISVIH